MTRTLATAIGIATSALLVLLALNLTPGIHMSPEWQLVAVSCIGVINLFCWYRGPAPALTLTEAAKVFSLGALILAGVAILDTMVGFIFHARTIPDAFINSGPLGGISDIFLFLLGTFVGVPTLVRAICLHYVDPKAGGDRA